MSGTKPINVPVAFIVRDFRGARLFLESVHRGNGFRWVADRSRACALEPSDALALCERASREYGAKCAVIDAQGNMAQPIAVRDFALYEAAKAADDAFQAELIRIYGVKKACEMRYVSKPYHDASLNVLSARKRAADEAWLLEMQKELS